MLVWVHVAVGVYDEMRGSRREIETRMGWREESAVTCVSSCCTTQVCHLQDTVHRECEERLELQESLSQAREQLHLLRRLGSGSGSESGCVPAAPHQPKSGTPRDSLEESRQRIANATRRSSRPSSRSLPRL